MTADVHRLVVLGAGFAGSECANRLQQAFGPAAHVVLVDCENFMVFHPLLPEVASGTIEAQHVINPVRALCPGVDFDCRKVERIDLEEQVVHFERSDGHPIPSRPYDHLVIAMGLVPNMGLVPGMSSHGLPMKTVGDAYAVRNQVLGCLEAAANIEDPALRRELLTIVTVGAGFSGVETCAEVHDLAAFALRYFPELKNETIRSVLVSATPRILPALSESASAHALKSLQRRDIDVRLKCRTNSVTPTRCFLNDGSEIAVRTVIGTIGNRPHPVLLSSGLQMERGRLVVDADMRCAGQERVWSVGDCARIVNALDGELCPPTAQYASRQGTQCGDNVAAALRGQPTQPFAFKPKGYAASLGYLDAIVESGRFRFTGILGWMIWRLMYLSIMPGWLRRMRVAIDWMFDLVFPRDIAQLVTRGSDRLGSRHYEPGQVVVREGDAADAFFLIERGTLEVVQNGEVLRRMESGAHFGEEALLTDGTRTATVRALEPSDLRVVTREDFETLVGGLSGLSSMIRQVAPTPEVSDAGFESRRHAQMKARAAGSVARPAPEAVDPDTPARELVERFAQTTGPVPIRSAGGFQRWIHEQCFTSSPVERIEQATVADLSVRAASCSPDTPMSEVAERFYREGLMWMAVVEEGSLNGIIGAMDVARQRIEAESGAADEAPAMQEGA